MTPPRVGGHWTASRASTWALLLAAFLAPAPGCGSNDEGPTERRARATVEELQEAFAAGTFERVCANLTVAARRHVELGGHLGSPDCYTTMRDFARGILRARDGGGARVPSVAAVSVSGNRGTAVIELDGVESELPLVRQDGEWKVDAMYGDLSGRRQLREGFR